MKRHFEDGLVSVNPFDAGKLNLLDERQYEIPSLSFFFLHLVEGCCSWRAVSRWRRAIGIRRRAEIRLLEGETTEERRVAT